MYTLLCLGGLFFLFLMIVPPSFITNIKCIIQLNKKLIFIPILFIIIILLILSSNATSSETDKDASMNEIKSTEAKTVNEPDSEQVEEPEIVAEKEEFTDEFTYRDMTVKYLKHEIVVDDIDQTVLVVYYDFTNNSDENKTFDYSFDDTCFQNGVEVERSLWHVNDESHNSGKEIQPDTTITVASSFVLGESRDAIELEITPWIGDKMLFEKTLELN